MLNQFETYIVNTYYILSLFGYIFCVGKYILGYNFNSKSLLNKIWTILILIIIFPFCVLVPIFSMIILGIELFD